MLRLLSPTNKRIKFKTARQGAELTGLTMSSVQAMLCGAIFSIQGWKSLHPKMEQQRREWRRQCSFVNVDTRELVIAPNTLSLQIVEEAYGIKKPRLTYLASHKKIALKGWMLKTTYDLIYGKNTYSRIVYVTPNNVKSFTQPENKVINGKQKIPKRIDKKQKT
jgi:hypothetical protein